MARSIESIHEAHVAIAFRFIFYCSACRRIDLPLSMSSTFNMGTSTPPKSGKKRSKPKRQPGLHTGPMDLPSFTLNKPQLPNDAHLRVPPQQFGSTGFNFAAQTQLPSTPTYPFANNVFKSDTSALPRAQNVNPNPMYAPATTHFGQAPFGEPSKPFDYSTSKRAFAFDELKKETVRVEKEAKPDTDSTFNKWTQLGELHADIWGQILKEREEWMELRREKQTWKDDEMNARQYVEHAASLRAAEEQKLAACQTEVAALKSEYDKLIAGIKEQEAKLEEVKGARAMEELQLTRDKENRRRQAMAFQLARDREEKMSKASSGSKSPPQVNVEVKADEAVSDFRNKQSSRLDFTAEITKHKVP